MISTEIADQQGILEIDRHRLTAAVAAVLEEERIEDAQISLAVVDDKTIHDLNRQYLGHDYATDVLSFVLDHSENRLEGQIIASAETAVSNSNLYGWTADAELLLYVVHGALHLVGVNDVTVEQREEMRRREEEILARFGLRPHWEVRE